MAEYLMEQRSYPDLENWEDSAEKMKAANEAVSKLRIYHQQQEEEIESEEEKRKAKEAFRKRQQEIARSQESLQRLSDGLNELAQRLGEQQAGYDFQDWFYNLVDFSEVSSRRPYVHAGRQIDGSITISGTTYLVELKFTKEQAGARHIDTFYKKVTNKADNTMGVMVSISGYSSTAKKEASGERTPLLLLDHSHLYLVLGGIMGLSEVIDRVRRHASQTGEAYLPVKEFTG
jgi:vacuolar-type H+-ATPase subunit I/STV1